MQISPLGLHWLGWHGGHGLGFQGPPVIPTSRLGLLSEMQVIGLPQRALMVVRLFRQKLPGEL